MSKKLKMITTNKDKTITLSTSGAQSRTGKNFRAKNLAGKF
jgi:hypothetical protein